MIPIDRVVREKRSLLLPLGIALVANIALFAVAVFPLSRRVAADEARAAQAMADRLDAERTWARAEAIVEGKDRADSELERFYGDILPADLTGARQITYLRLSQLAANAGLRVSGGIFDVTQGDDSRLSKLNVELSLTGDYRNIRRFIYALETAPEFVVIEDVALARPSTPGAPLQITMDLATYYVTGDGR